MQMVREIINNDGIEMSSADNDTSPNFIHHLELVKLIYNARRKIN